MNDRLHRAKSQQDSIRQIVLNEWDPIGVAGVPEAQDEYDSYIAKIYGMLIRREPRHNLVDFLWWAETGAMGLYGSRQRTERVADLLLQLTSDAAGSTRLDWLRGFHDDSRFENITCHLDCAVRGRAAQSCTGRSRPRPDRSP